MASLHIKISPIGDNTNVERPKIVGLGTSKLHKIFSIVHQLKGDGLHRENAELKGQLDTANVIVSREKTIASLENRLAEAELKNVDLKDQLSCVKATCKFHSRGAFGS